MSRALTDMVLLRDCGSPLRKTMLWALCDIAKDDGSGIFVSNATLAAYANCSDRAAISVLQALERDMLIRRVGKEPCRGGHTIIWAIDVEALGKLTVPQRLAKTTARRAQVQSRKSSATGAEVPVSSGRRTTERCAEHQTTERNAEVHESTAAGAQLPAESTAPRAHNPLGVGGDVRPTPLWRVVIDRVGHRWLDALRSPGLREEGATVQRWVDEGADLEADIIPTVGALLAKLPAEKAPIASWRYFEKAIRRATEKRLAAEAEPRDPIKPAQRFDTARPGSNDFKLNDILRRMTSEDRALHRRLTEAGHEDERFALEAAYAQPPIPKARPLDEARGRAQLALGEFDYVAALDRYELTERRDWPRWLCPPPGKPGYNGPDVESLRAELDRRRDEREERWASQ